MIRVPFRISATGPDKPPRASFGTRHARTAIRHSFTISSPNSNPPSTTWYNKSMWDYTFSNNEMKQKKPDYIIYILVERNIDSIFG